MQQGVQAECEALKGKLEHSRREMKVAKKVSRDVSTLTYHLTDCIAFPGANSRVRSSRPSPLETSWAGVAWFSSWSWRSWS